MRATTLFLSLCSALSAAPTATAADYYVSPTGDDGSAGSRAAPWRTVARVSATKLTPGTRVFLQGGAAFAGPLTLDAADQGRPGEDVVIDSYGDGNATISGGAGTAIVLAGSRHVRVQNLTLVGLGRKTGNHQGDGVLVADSAAFITIQDVEASGFQRAGIHLRRVDDVRVTRCRAHDNGFAGIFTDAKGPRNQRLTVDRCHAYANDGDPTITDNPSGNGILYTDTDASVIDLCEAQENGRDQPTGHPGGPVGIWTTHCDRITIQRCISHHNASSTGDGGGFDLDGGTTNSLIQYCYSYANKSSGYLMWEYGAGGIHDNVVRFCVSENDGEAGFRFGQVGPDGVRAIRCYRNTVISDRSPAVAVNSSGLTDIAFYDNLFIATGTQAITDVDPSLTYTGNGYWRTDGLFSVGGYASLAAWATGTGQETVDGAVVGLFADPLLTTYGSAPHLTDATLLPTLVAFRLPAGSPAVDRGLDLRSLFRIEQGPRDLFANPSLKGAADLGAYELP